MTKLKKYKKKSKGAYLPWVILGFFLSLNIFFTIITATSGAQYNELESTRNDLISENQVLENELISLSSLKSIEEEAYELGFIKPSKVLYVTFDENVAKAH